MQNHNDNLNTTPEEAFKAKASDFLQEQLIFLRQQIQIAREIAKSI
ncbi:MAG TPA: hypothetical protein V6C86_05755 [Oculatellaceae cyanobacterium]